MNEIMNATITSNLSDVNFEMLEKSIKAVYVAQEMTKYTECVLYAELVDRIAKDNDIIKSKGYDKVDDYLVDTFKKSKAYVYRMANVARTFINADTVSCNTLEDNGTADTENAIVSPMTKVNVFKDDYSCEYNVSVLAELMQMNIDRDENGKPIKVNNSKLENKLEIVRQFCSENGIDSTTPQNKVRELVSAYNKPTISTTASENDTENGTENGTENNIEKPMTDIDRINAILEIVKSIESEECKNAIIKPLNAWVKKLSE